MQSLELIAVSVTIIMGEIDSVWVREEEITRKEYVLEGKDDTSEMWFPPTYQKKIKESRQVLKDLITVYRDHYKNI
ncbi:MAG: hypothetical protein NY202_02975 [Mollicutes bacterium UO1]